MHIYLVGFMASGKTTVGRELAAARNLSFVDLDEVVELRAGRSISEIFDRSGEPRFRELEHEALREVAARSPAVVAAGGGAFATERNAELMRRTGITVWLDVPFDTIVRRVGEGEERARPLFESEEGARELFETRRDAYRRADERIVVRGDETASEVASRIDRRLGGRPAEGATHRGRLGSEGAD